MLFGRRFRGRRSIVLRVAEIVVVGLKHVELCIALQAVDDQLFDDVIDDSKQRYTHDHAHKAPQTAEQQDGEQDLLYSPLTEYRG